MFVIGTAGHIDHGKSTLIKALTGADPDRLKEEQERGMTIDLGFAFLTLPSGREVGMVDVPGHQRFVKNMLAGVGGVDLVILVVAATESWMPQSQEHLEIIDLLQIERGVIALTKSDLADEEWLDLVEEEVRERVRGTVLDEAPIVRVSAVQGEGITTLLEAVDALLDTAPEPLDLGRPRLWIDRVFSVKGAGTVVTGSLQGGGIAVEDELELIPSGQLVRVRGLQAHNRQLDRAPAGGRVAVNLAGIESDEIERGDALARPGTIAPSGRFNAVVRTVPSLAHPLRNGAEVKVYLGTAERMARIKLLEKEQLGPGEEGLAQIELEQACAAAWNDRFVIRDPGQQATVGGGRILETPARAVHGLDHRFRRSEVSEAHRVLVGTRTPERLDLGLLRARIGASVEELLWIALEERGWIERRALDALVPASREALGEALARAAERGAVLLPSFAVSRKAWERLRERVRAILAEYHERYPLRSGLARETLRSNLGVDWRFFDEVMAALAAEGLIAAAEARVRLASHEVAFDPATQAQADRLIEHLGREPYAPPSLDGLLEEHGISEELVSALAEQGRIVRIAKGIAFTREAFDEIRQRVVGHIEAEGSIDVGALRDLLGTSRKYALPLLEYFDQIEVTRRIGDKRVLVRRG